VENFDFPTASKKLTKNFKKAHFTTMFKAFKIITFFPQQKNRKIAIMKGFSDFSTFSTDTTANT